MNKSSQVSTIWTTCYSLGELKPIEVQVLLRTGIPRFDIIGLPQNMIREGRDRILAALSALGIEINSQRVLVSLNPGDIPKEGSHFDLPILVGLLRVLGILKPSESKDFFWGEVSLDGKLQPLPDLLAHLLFANHLSASSFVASPRADPVDFIFQHLKSPPRLISHIKDLFADSTPALKKTDRVEPQTTQQEWINTCPEKSRWNQLRGSEDQFLLWTLTMLGRHHLLMQGPPGCGKTTWCRAARELQPPLVPQKWFRRFQYQPRLSESFFDCGQLSDIPFEAPHHTSSRASIVGGGSAQVVAGAVTRAHQGILFLDELLEFSRDCLESLREPLETKSITIARQGIVQTLDADIQLLAAMNPCRCGSTGSRHRCHCGNLGFNKYQQRLSGPLKDRFHIRCDWQFANQAHPKEFELKYVRERLTKVPNKEDIRILCSKLPFEHHARMQRNWLELFVSWCRLFSIREADDMHAKEFSNFLNRMEVDYETTRKTRQKVR